MKRKKVNCHDKLMWELCTGPKTSKQLKESVGAGFYTRVYEFNKSTKSSVLYIKKTKNFYHLWPREGIDMPGAEIYPGYHLTGKYIHPKQQIEKFGRRIDNL